jgi:hypothetical protein
MTDLTDLIERAWGVLSRWAVPVMMTLAYALLVATSETDATGKAWMAAGLLLVMTAWFTFRALADAAALSRALAVGDTARLLALADHGLSHRRARRPPARARLLVARGLAHLLRGELSDALDALDAAEPAPDLQPLATALRIVVQVELDRADELDTVPVASAVASAVASPVASAVASPGTSPGAPWLAWLADGVLAWRAGRLDTATPLLTRVIDDIRAGSAIRAIAELYAARIADARRDLAAAARHRAAAAALAAPDATWLRGGPAPERLHG